MFLLLPTSILRLKAQNASQGHYIVPLPASCSLFCMLRFIWADANALHMKVSTREESSSIRQKGQKKQRQKVRISVSARRLRLNKDGLLPSAAGPIFATCLLCSPLCLTEITQQAQ